LSKNMTIVIKNKLFLAASDRRKISVEKAYFQQTLPKIIFFVAFLAIKNNLFLVAYVFLAVREMVRRQLTYFQRCWGPVPRVPWAASYVPKNLDTT
jgi:hypothetical protein